MSQEPNPGEGKKIIIDEDWKSQVEKEREAAEKGETPESEAVSAQEAEGGAIPWPDPTLSVLITTLATQATIGLGIMAHPATGKPEPDLAQAKHLIDMLAMLQEKTEGNRTQEETMLLEQVVHELRMAYVSLSTAGQ